MAKRDHVPNWADDLNYPVPGSRQPPRWAPTQQNTGSHLFNPNARLDPSQVRDRRPSNSNRTQPPNKDTNRFEQSSSVPGRVGSDFKWNTRNVPGGEDKIAGANKILADRDKKAKAHAMQNLIDSQWRKQQSFKTAAQNDPDYSKPSPVKKPPSGNKAR